MFYYRDRFTGVITKSSKKESNYTLPKVQGWKDRNNATEFDKRESLYVKVLKELSKPLTRIVKKGTRTNKLTKKKWQVIRSIHGRLGISRYETKRMLNII